MNANTSESETLIESSLNRAVRAYPPPAGLKQAVARRIEAEQARLESTRRRWRIKPWLARAAAASVAAAALAGGIWLTLGHGSGSSAYAELVQAVANTRSAEWVHFRLPGESGETDFWLSFSPHREFCRNAEGVVYVDGAKRLHYDYDGKTQTLTIKPLADSAAAGLSQPTFLDMMLAKMERIQERTGTRITKARERIGDKELVVYSLTYEYGSPESRRQGRSELRVDRGVGRVASIKESGDAWPTPLEVKLDYPKAGPKDIYDLGVPRDARIVDKTKGAREPASDPAKTAVRPTSP